MYLYYYTYQSQIQDFAKEAVPSRRDSVGGGVVAEFSVGSKRRRDSVGGGSTMNFPLMGPFYMFSH